jgi:hypothetical protein
MSVKKLTRAEEALESTVTCMACMGIFTSPVLCVPCGQATTNIIPPSRQHMLAVTHTVSSNTY